MTKVAFRVFVTQGSSAESERHFSTTGDNLCAKITRMSPEMAEKLTMLKINRNIVLQ